MILEERRYVIWTCQAIMCMCDHVLEQRKARQRSYSQHNGQRQLNTTETHTTQQPQLTNHQAAPTDINLPTEGSLFHGPQPLLYSSVMDDPKFACAAQRLPSCPGPSLPSHWSRTPSPATGTTPTVPAGTGRQCGTCHGPEGGGSEE